MFDLDGTVWDSEAGIVGCLEHTFESLGLPAPSSDVLAANLGPPLQQMLGELGVPEEVIERATTIYRDRYVAWGAYQATVYPGVVDAIDRLIDAGHLLATATSKGRDPTLQMLDHFGLTGRFEAIGAASMDASAADKIAVLGGVLDLLGRPAPIDCLMVGDRSYDVLGARSHGVDCIGVTWGYGSEEELRSAGASHVISAPDELLPLVPAPVRRS